ncbi:MAG: uracil-DNA glycosylase [Fimbriimonadaceae bacterium]|nr:uracil-DNA glycosylase [Alphaproteobacteria bacterium]
MSENLSPERDCDLCPRLVDFRREQRKLHDDWHNAPVPSFGSIDANLLIVGLAPGLRGANRTGRPFTGDFAGDLLYATLGSFGFLSGTYRSDPDDGIQLINCRITNAVRCVPPQNKPVGAELSACRPFLAREISAMPNLKALLALGRIAHENILRTLDLKLSALPFAHGSRHDLGNGLTLHDSYHCSRYNTNTGRLTEDMFRQVVQDIQQQLK